MKSIHKFQDSLYIFCIFSKMQCYARIMNRYDITDLVAVCNADTDAKERLGWLLGSDGPVSRTLDEVVGGPLNEACELLWAEGAEKATEKRCCETALAEKDAAMQAQRAERSLSQCLPRVALTGSYGLDGENFMEMDGDQDSYFVGPTVTWNIFDTGIRDFCVREAEDMKTAAGIRALSERQRVRLRARSAVRRAIRARKEYESAWKKTASDLLKYQQNEKAYAVVRGSFGDFLDAQRGLAADRLEEACANCDSKSAEAEYLEAIGFWVEWENN